MRGAPREHKHAWSSVHAVEVRMLWRQETKDTRDKVDTRQETSEHLLQHARILIPHTYYLLPHTM